MGETAQAGAARDLVGSPVRAAEAAADLCDDGPMVEKPYEPQIVVDRIRRLLAARPRPK